MERMKRLSEALRMLIEEGFSGYIRINFSQGSLGRIEKFEEIEAPEVVLSESPGGSRKSKYKEGTV